MSKDTGGPAFPVANREYATNDDLGLPEYVKDSPFYGMTLRDYFAGESIKLQIVSAGKDFTKMSMEELYAEFALNAYRMADAMLAERAK